MEVDRKITHWIRDVLLTLLVPPLGLVFTGPMLFRSAKRHQLSRQELIALVVLFLGGMWLTGIRVGALTMHSSFTESGG